MKPFAIGATLLLGGCMTGPYQPQYIQPTQPYAQPYRAPEPPIVFQRNLPPLPPPQPDPDATPPPAPELPPDAIADPLPDPPLTIPRTAAAPPPPEPAANVPLMGFRPMRGQTAPTPAP